MRSCQSDTGPIIKKLSSDTLDGGQAFSKLLEVAKQSPECRDEVIKGVIGGLTKADLENDDSAFGLWARGSAILSDLKAVEAIDLLVAHLDLSDGFFSASMVHEPVGACDGEIGRGGSAQVSFCFETQS